MKLSEKLKSIYTQGDTYTVLQLLNKLIKAIEEYEQETQSDLYAHNIHFNWSSARLSACICLYTNSSSPIVTQGNLLSVLGTEEYNLICTGDVDYDPIINCHYDGDFSFVTSQGSEGTIFDFTQGTITDTVVKVN